jgi:hypothetical protein
MKHYVSDFTLGETWRTLSVKHGFATSEDLRGWFKNNRKKRGIPSKKEDFKKTVEMNIPSSSPRVGILDIETLPIIGYAWDIWQQNIGIEQIIKDSCILSWAGKFLNEPTMYSDILTSKESKERNTERIVKSCWEFLSKCHVVIGHNFQSFDSKHLNTAFLHYDLPPLKYTIVDTLLVSKQNFRFTSNKMAYINKVLGIQEKLDHEGFPMWRGCDEGKQESLDAMLDYNLGDIGATEELFYIIRPYVKNFNIALYNETEEAQCPVCGSTELTNEGYYYTPAGKWESMRCNKCKCISRKKENLLSKDKRKSLLINS